MFRQVRRILAKLRQSASLWWSAAGTTVAAGSKPAVGPEQAAGREPAVGTKPAAGNKSAAGESPISGLTPNRFVPKLPNGSLLVLLGCALALLLILLWPPQAGSRHRYSTTLWSADGQLLGAAVSADGQWRFPPAGSPVDADGAGNADSTGTSKPSDKNLAQAQNSRYQLALIAFEDRRFAGHLGLDSRALVRALRDNLSSGSIVSGASTISMQTARLLYGNRSRTYAQKLLELLTAFRLEFRMSKTDLLDLYASLAPYGANVVGIEAAGFRWFGRPSDQLTWAEAALLAVLPNSPALIHPARGRDQLLAKRNRLLDFLAQQGQLDSADLSLALSEPLPAEPLPMPRLAPHLTASAAAGSRLPPEVLSLAAQDGVWVSSLDYRLQLDALALAERQARRLGLQGINNLAALIIRVSDGTVVAHIGNVLPAADRPGSFVDCTQAARSSGSILKPFLYAAMLDSGELTPGRLVPDIPTRVGSYSPENNLKTFSGAVRADEALARSLNIPFVRLLRDYGVERFGSLLQRLQFKQLHRAIEDYGLTLILGGAENTLLEAASAYRHLAACALGYDSTQLGDPVFSPAAAWLTLEALIQVGRPAEEASWQHYATSRQVSWKTGTSFGNKDAWAIGVTPEYVVAVWVGNSSGEGRPEIKGTDAAAPFLFDLFQLLPRSAWFPRPDDDLRTVTVCADSGYIAGRDCPATARIHVPRNAQVDTVCPYCRLVYLSADRQFQVSAACAGPESMVTEARFVLPPVMEWYYARTVLGYRSLPPWSAACQPLDTLSMEFVVPEDRSSLYIPVELDGKPGQTVFRAVHRDPEATIFWHLDDQYLGQTSLDHRFELRPSYGEHSITLVDSSGQRISRRFTILSEE